ncbi:MAG: peptidylprolyl isomerase [Planctomycetota bacterium]|nr:peptidylprolyl isomerase [Planctomycetota bacterium]
MITSTRTLLLLSTCFGSFVACGCDKGGTAGTSVTASIDTSTQRRPVDALPASNDSLHDPRFPIVSITTNLGTIRVQLDLEKAPITGKNFLWYAGNGHYNGTIFHQIVPGYMALGGGYTEQFEEKPTQFWIRNEAFNGLKNRKGTIAMARRPDQADSSTCQFFFNLVDNPHLDHRNRKTAEDYGYCVFGRVVEGMDVLDKMNRVSVQDDGQFPSVPTPAIVIERVGT